MTPGKHGKVLHRLDGVLLNGIEENALVFNRILKAIRDIDWYRSPNQIITSVYSSLLVFIDLDEFEKIFLYRSDLD